MACPHHQRVRKTALLTAYIIMREAYGKGRSGAISTVSFRKMTCLAVAHLVEVREAGVHDWPDVQNISRPVRQ
jgi:hypothetical protein